MFQYSEIASLVPDEQWKFTQTTYEPEQNLKLETLMTLANGYTGVRGCLEEGATPRRPGSFIAGVYDKGDAASKTIVNLPDWLPLRLWANGTPINPDHCTVVRFTRVLDLSKGLLLRSGIYRDDQERETLVEGYRFVSMAHSHRAAIVTLVRPLNWNGELRIAGTVDGGVSNSAADGSREEHFRPITPQPSHQTDGQYLEVATRDSGIHIGIATRMQTAALDPAVHLSVEEKQEAGEHHVGQQYTVKASADTTVRTEKLIVQYTSRDLGSGGSTESTVADAACAELQSFQEHGVAAELMEHRQRFEELWDVTNIEIAGDEEADWKLRFNIFHLLSCYTGDDPDISIGAKGLHGEGYKGQIFWDSEIFLFPFYLYTRPTAARSLLMYRYNRLSAARRNARENGFAGALYPWNSADTGDEDSPTTATTIAGDSIPWDASTLVHINAAVAYAVVQYCKASADREFADSAGLELLVETARFWASRARFDTSSGEYMLENVIGPDEFHPYVDNNFYTNAMAQWNLEAAADFADNARSEVPEKYAGLEERLQLSEDEIRRWREIAAGVRISIDPDTRVAEQFDGYFELEDFQVSELDENRLPRWPHGVDLRKLHETQIIKQADVIHALYLLSDRFDEKTRRANYDYYLKRTVHRSTLSASIYSLMALTLGDDSEAYRSFMRTIEADLVDSQGSAAEGIHIASSAGGWTAAVLGFGGLKLTTDGGLTFAPHIPRHWTRLRFRVHWQGTSLEADFTPTTGNVRRVSPTAKTESEKVSVMVKGREIRC